MKLFRLIGTMTIVAAVAATMAVSASAATATLNGNNVTVDTEAEAVATGYTVLVSSAKENADPTEEQVYQLYQNAELGDIALPADLPAGKYYVRVGGIATGIENTSFVKTATVPAEGALFNDENATDAKVAYYYVTTGVPGGLTPYWTNGVKEKPALIDMEMANLDGTINLGLRVDGANAFDEDMALLWK